MTITCFAGPEAEPIAQWSGTDWRAIRRQIRNDMPYDSRMLIFATEDADGSPLTIYLTAKTKETA